MNEQLKKLVEQAGFEISSSNFADLGWVWCSDEYPIDKQLERFAEIVRQDERKSCAKILDAFAKDMENKEWTMGAAAMRGAADTIRFKQINDETEGEK